MHMKPYGKCHYKRALPIGASIIHNKRQKERENKRSRASILRFFPESYKYYLLHGRSSDLFLEGRLPICGRRKWPIDRQTLWNLQQRELFPILTGFPFNPEKSGTNNWAKLVFYSSIFGFLLCFFEKNINKCLYNTID